MGNKKSEKRKRRWIIVERSSIATDYFHKFSNIIEMKSCITAIGTANPEHRVAQERILSFMAEAHQLSAHEAGRLAKIYEHSGIDFRHSVIPDFAKENGSYTFFSNTPNLEPFPNTKQRANLFKDTAIHISMEAAKRCLKLVPNFNPKEITHLITVSCTGMYAPGIDIELVEQLQLNPSVERTCINFMGCYGAFNALKMADYICRADEQAKVLIVDIEICTIHFQKENTLDNWIANSLFADGAAAVLVENSISERKGFEMKAFHSELISSAKNDMAWAIGNFGFEMRLSSQIAKKIKQTIHSVADTLLQKAKISLGEIQQFAIHPGGRRILEVCEEEFNRGSEINANSYEILKNYGNMSSATVLFVINEFWKQKNKLKSAEPILSFAFGPGLTFESMILQVQ
jgi:predicted naringenin-chalcone synthase